MALDTSTVGVTIVIGSEELHKPAVVSRGDPSAEGTVKPYLSFNAETDCRRLNGAMKGFGTDQSTILYILAYRSNAQRQRIRTKYQTLYNKDLLQELKSNLSGNFGQVILALMMTPIEYDAYELRNAVKGVGTAEHVLIELLCTRSNEEIKAIKEEYTAKFGRDLEKDIMSDTSGHFKRFMKFILSASRDPDGPTDNAKVHEDAKALYQAGEAKWRTDQATFNLIFASRSFSHLAAVFSEYIKISKNDIEQSISRELSGDLKAGMLAIVHSVRNKASFFADRLYKSTKGLSTDDPTLIRVMVMRSEVDMVQIKKKFRERYSQSLGSSIKDKTSGNYRKALMALADEQL